MVGNDSKVELRQIVTTGTFGSYWVVSNGLKVGDRVIVQGTDKARPGMQVKPVAAQLPATPASDAAAQGAPAASGAAQTAQPASAASGA